MGAPGRQHFTEQDFYLGTVLVYEPIVLRTASVAVPQEEPLKSGLLKKRGCRNDTGSVLLCSEAGYPVTNQNTSTTPNRKSSAEAG